MFKKSSIIILIIIILITFVAVVQINIINTKALSPIGNTENNYDMVSKEFGKDFTDFIKDSSPVKIYTEEEGTTIYIMDQEYIITKSNPIIQFANKVGSSVSSGFMFVKTKVDNFIKNINSNSSDTNASPEEKSSSEVDSIIDGYIEKNKDVDVDNKKNGEDAMDVTTKK